VYGGNGQAGDGSANGIGVDSTCLVGRTSNRLPSLMNCMQT